MEFDFVKGSDLIVKINSDIIGGVRKIVCKEENAYTNIASFLTDIPVHRVDEKKYSLILTFDCSENTLYFDENITSVDFLTKNKVERFTKCVVKSFEKYITPSGVIEGVLTVGADERTVD